LTILYQVPYLLCPSFIDPCLLVEEGERAWGIERARREGRGEKGRVRHAILPQETFSPKISTLESRVLRENVIST
ncbi:hypothetical protein PENTCL1PPCAC_8275, partial [Pristionchus entomophagus]